MMIFQAPSLRGGRGSDVIQQVGVQFEQVEPGLPECLRIGVVLPTAGSRVLHVQAGEMETGDTFCHLSYKQVPYQREHVVLMQVIQSSLPGIFRWLFQAKALCTYFICSYDNLVRDVSQVLWPIFAS